MIKVVVFDMDDTLFPEHEFVHSGFRAVSDFVRGEFGVDTFYQKASKRFAAGDRGRIFNQVLEELRIESDSLVRQCIEVYRSHKPSIALFEDARWALEQFAQFPMALLSDGYLETQQNKAEALNIAPCFEKLYFTDQWGRQCWKPSSCAYEKIEQDFSVSGEECIYIADNPTKDFVAPNQLSWRSVWVNRGGGEYQGAEVAEGGHAELEIDSLYGLEMVLK